MKKSGFDRGTTKLSFAISAIMMLVMVGCLQGDKKDKDIAFNTYGSDKAAAFIVPRIDIQNRPSDTMEVWPDIQTAKNYRFEACIQFRATQNKVVSQEFQVESASGVVHKGQTDVNGCLRWQEKFPFNFFAEQKYMQFDRVLRGTGVVRGYQTIKFAIDPWKESRGGNHPEWEYLNQPNIEEQTLIEPANLVSGDENVLKAMNNGFTHDLLLGGLKMFTQQKRELKQGVEVSLNLEMNPWVQLKTINGQLKPYQLNSGKFTVYASIIGKGMHGDMVYKEGMELEAGQRARTYVVNKATNEKYLFKYKKTTAAQDKIFNECSEKVERDNLLVRTEAQGLKKDEEYVQYVTDEGCNILVHEINGSLTPMLRAEKVDMFQGKLHVTFPDFKIEYHNTSGTMVFAINVVPEGIDPGSLKPYKAVHLLGEFNKWLGSKSPMVLALNNEQGEANGTSGSRLQVPFDDLMNSVPEGDLTDKTRDYYRRHGIRPLEAYEFSPLKISYTSVEAGETATQRTIAYDVRVQITRPIMGGAPAQDVRLLVKTDSRPNGIYAEKTEQGGWVRWEDQVSHAYYEVEHFIRKPINFTVITNEASKRFTKTLDAAINPWDLFATFGKDIRYDMTAKRLLEEYEEWAAGDRKVPYKIESRFNVDKFNYTAIKFDYTIDKDLSLEVKKTVLFKVDPEVQRYSSIVDGRKIEWLRDGVWLMKVAIQKDYLDPARKGSQIIRDCQGMSRYVEPGESYHTFVVDPETGDEKCKLVDRSDEERPDARPRGYAEMSEQEKQAYEEQRRVENASIYKVDERHFVTFQKRLVRVINGRINTPVTLSMRDLRLMRIRSNLLVQLEPIDETKLGVANWLREQIDQRAKIEERLRGDNKVEFFEDLDDAAEKIAEWFGSVKKDVEQDKANQRQALDEVAKLMAGPGMSGLSDKEKYLRADRELKAKSIYWEQRKNLIDTYLSNLNSDKIRQAYANNDRATINKELAAVFEKGKAQRVKMFLLGHNFEEDVIKKYTTDGDGTRIFGDQVRQHYFPQTVNTPIDVGLLSAINEKFSMTEDQMAERRLNDFTVESLGSSFSLDLLVEPFDVSGLRKRSFIGPVTFLINSNGSQIRPTDTLAEVFCRNNACAAGTPTERELKEWTWSGDRSFMYKRFYNSVRHFFDKDVDDLIICKLGGVLDDPSFCGPNMPYELAYERDQEGNKILSRPIMNAEGKQKYDFLGYDEIRARRLDVASLIPNFLEQNDLKYVSLADNPEPLRGFRFDRTDCTVLNSHKGYGKNRRRNDSQCFYDYKVSVLPVDNGQHEQKVHSREEFIDTLNEKFLISDDDLKAWAHYQSGERSTFKLEGDDLKAFRDKFKTDCLEKRENFSTEDCQQRRNLLLRSTKPSSLTSYRDRRTVEEAKAMEAEKDRLEALIKDQTLTVEDLRDFVRGKDGVGPQGNKQVLVKMCSYLAENLAAKLNRYDYLSKEWTAESFAMHIMSKCAEPETLDDSHPFLMVDERLRVLKTGDYRFKGGKSMNINVSSSIGIDQKDSVGVGPSYNPYGAALSLVGGLVGGAVGSLAGPLGTATGLVVGSALGGASYSMKWDSGTGRSNGTGLNLGTYLVMQTAAFDIQLEAFERCAVVKFDRFGLINPDNTHFKRAIDKQKANPDPQFTLTREYEDQLRTQKSALDSGLMVCSGEIEEVKPVETNGDQDADAWNWYSDQKFVEEKKIPKAIRERYYYFTQHFTEGDMLDAGDLYNHPWLLMLRGRRDFNIFMAGLNQFARSPRAYWDPTKNPNNLLRNIDGSLGKPITMVQEYEWPIDNMIRTYLDVLPTFPGLYTALANEPRDFPWGDKQPHESFGGPVFTGMGTDLIKVSLDGMTKEQMENDPECEGNGGPARCVSIRIDDKAALKKRGIDKGIF